MAFKAFPSRAPRVPLLTLLNSHGTKNLFLLLSLIGLLIGWLAVTKLAAPVWRSVVFALVLLLYPAVHKWSIDARYWGRSIMVMSILLATQGFHTIEHVVQWVQFHLLSLPLKESSGLISPLNAEVVHFAWNWLVLITVVYLIWAGHRNSWMWLLLLWTTAHTFEHTYMFVNYLIELQRLAQFGVPLSAAQGLPGILGKGGWLATRAYDTPIAYYICTLVPAVKNAPRLDVHFWWNIGETLLLLLACNHTMRSRLR